MQVRTFLGNQSLIKEVTAGKHFISNASTSSGNTKPCEDYVFEKKLEKALKKLELFNDRKSIDLDERDFSRFGALIKITTSKENLIKFIEASINTVQDIKIFFAKSWDEQ